jgi:hypothetical protein
VCYRRRSAETAFLPLIQHRSAEGIQERIFSLVRPLLALVEIIQYRPSERSDLAMVRQWNLLPVRR